MASSFDLLRNPFVLLGLDLFASARRVAEAFEDAVADGHASEPELVAARQAILIPTFRLKAEVGALADTPSSEWRSILIALKSSQNASSLRQAFANVAPLSRSNLIAHVASRTQPDASTLTAWIAAQSAISLDQIHRQIEQLRETAGVVRPERGLLSSTLGSLREQQARAMFDGFEYSPDAIAAVTACTEQVISIGDPTQIDVLSNLLSAYNRHIEQELSFRRQRITSTANALRSDLDGAGNLAMVVDALKYWDQAARPLQLLEAYKGRDEPSAQEVLQELRSFSIDLVNDLSRFDLALSITKCCQSVFARLPRTVQQLGDDQATIEERILYSKVNPLAVAMGEIGDALPKLSDDLRIGGFSQSAIGSAKSLRDAFVISAKASKDSAIAETPWLIVRSFAVKLNNDLGAHDSAFALMKGLLDLGQDLDASEDVLTRLREDKRAAERNYLDKVLLEQMKKSEWRNALSTIDNLLQDYKSPEERDILQKLKLDVEGKRRGKYFRWGFGIAVLAIIVWASTDQKSSGPNHSFVPPAPDRSSASSGPIVHSFIEVMPSVGTDLSFTETNIRYCMYQRVRLDYMKPRVSSNFAITKFNLLVDDYNSRCGSFRYRPNDRSAVEAELPLKRSDLELQAQSTLNNWQR